MRVVMEHERAKGKRVYDVHERNLGYDVTSLDLQSGELRLIEIKGLAAETGTILLTPNERRVAEDRRDCYWLYIVTKLCRGAGDAGTHSGPRQVPLARGQPGAALLAAGGRHDEANERVRIESRLSEHTTNRSYRIIQS